MSIIEISPKNRQKWVAGKVTGQVAKKMFIAQGPDGHCRRHEDQLKLHSVQNPNRQLSLKHSAAPDLIKNCFG